MIIHACCSDDDISVLSSMLFSAEGLYIETGSCKFWFYVSVLRHRSYHSIREKNSCECAQGYSLVGGGVHPESKINILNENSDFSRTKKFR
jgi:hypothetical protein